MDADENYVFFLCLSIISPMFYPLLPLISTSKSGHVFAQYTPPVTEVSNITDTHHESEENGAKQFHFHHNFSQFYTDVRHSVNVVVKNDLHANLSTNLRPHYVVILHCNAGQI